MYAVIEDSRDQIAQLCRLCGVRRLEIFGSALREDFNPETSDVDVVAEFEKLSQADGVRDNDQLPLGLSRCRVVVQPVLRGGLSNGVLAGLTRSIFLTADIHRPPCR